MKVSALLLSLIPGLGQILKGRYLRGMVFFFSFVILIDLILVIVPCVWGLETARDVSPVFLISIGIIWSYNILDILRIIYWRERDSLKAKKKVIFLEGISFYLQNKLEEAGDKFRRVLSLDRDDPDAIFYLATVLKRMGKLSKANSFFRKCLALDEKEKWRWEISRELKD